MKSQENAKGANVRSNTQEPQKCKHLGDYWSCGLTAETDNDGLEWEQPCDFYPHCEECPRFTPKTN